MSALLIFGSRWCRALSVEIHVVYSRLVLYLWPCFGFGKTFLSLMPDFQHSVSVAVTVDVKTVSVPFVYAVAAGACARAQEPGRRFPRKRVGGAPGAYERQIRKNRTRSGWDSNPRPSKSDTGLPSHTVSHWIIHIILVFLLWLASTKP